MSRKLNKREFFKYSLGGGSLILTGGLASCSGFAGSNEAQSRFAHPWWVEEVEEPLLAVDNGVYRKFESKNNVFGSFAKYVGPTKVMNLRRIRKERTEEYFAENRPGFRIEDRALAAASWTVSRTGGLNRGLRSWNRKSMRTPEQQMERKYKDSPQKAAHLVKQAARYFGAATVGIALLDRRHINAREFYRGHEVDIVFEHVEKPYAVEGEKLVIPEKCKYAISLSIQMSLDCIKTSPSAIGGAGAALGYSRAEFLVGSLAEFIRGLGYTAIPSVNDLGSSVAIAVDAGLGELGRTNRLITPEYGPNVRLAKVLTDLPMSTDKPIKFGPLEFCKVCKRCAEACPSKALSFKDEPDFEVRGPWNNPGHQAWFEDATKCLAYWSESTVGCSVCLAVCPWAKKDKTMVHSMVKAASAKMPFLDGVFTSLDKTFGYGEQKDSEKWWHLDLPEYGIETSQGRKEI